MKKLSGAEQNMLRLIVNTPGGLGIGRREGGARDALRRSKLCRLGLARPGSPSKVEATDAGRALVASWETKPDNPRADVYRRSPRMSWATCPREVQDAIRARAAALGVPASKLVTEILQAWIGEDDRIAKSCGDPSAPNY